MALTTFDCLQINNTSQFNDTLGFGTNGRISWGGNPSRFIITSCGGYNLGFGTDNFNDRMTIQSSTGNVGIGNTGPSAPLHVCAGGGDQSPILRLGGSAANSFNWASATIYPNVTSGQSIIHLVGKAQSQYNSGYVGFRQVADNCSTNMVTLGMYAADNLVNILGTGNVGIGTTSPSYRLVTIGNEGAIHLRVNSDGVGSNVHIRPNAGRCGWVSFTEDAVADRWGIGIKNGDSKLYFSSGNVSGDGGTARMVLDGSGNVGIGCNTPRNKVEIIGGTSSPDLCAASCDLLKIGGSGNSALNIGSTVVSPYGMWFQVKHQNLDTNTYPIVFQPCGGNTGIGIMNPTYKLHVNGTFYAAGSSIKYKEGICNYDTNSCLFMCLKPVTYQYKDEFKHLGKELKSETQIGLIAEDVAEVMPELAVLVNEEDNKVVRNVDYEKLSIILLSEVQKLRQEVDDLKNKQ